MSILNLEKLELREIVMPLKAPFKTSFGTSFKRRILIVDVTERDGTQGFGECTATEEPFFNHETIDTAWLMIKDFIGPALASRQIKTASQVGHALAAIRGNRMAIGGVETAIWDLESRKLNEPLWKHLGGSLETIDCGVSIGLQGSPGILLDKVTHEVEAGYKRIKLKIMPGQDIELVRTIREAFPDIKLSVDANSAYQLAEHLDIFLELDKYDLLMIEQPLAAGDLVDHAKLQNKISTPICLDESITSLRDARHAVELGACRIINIKLGRVGGHSEASAIQRYAADNGIPVWCGGMLESGIGRAHNIAMSTLPGFTLPGDVSASARYWEQDIIEPPVVVSGVGTIEASSDVGIGYGINDARIEELTVRRETIPLA